MIGGGGVSPVALARAVIRSTAVSGRFPSARIDNIRYNSISGVDGNDGSAVSEPYWS